MEIREAENILRRLARPTDLVPVSEAAVRARLNPFTIWKLIRNGTVRAYGRRGSLRVSLAELLPEYKPKGDQ